MKSIVNKWIEAFHNKGEKIIPFLVNCRLPRMILLEFYKDLLPIETMPEKEKKEMKRYVMELFPEKTVSEKMEACKIIYTFGNLIND